MTLQTVEEIAVDLKNVNRSKDDLFVSGYLAGVEDMAQALRVQMEIESNEK